MAGSFSRFPFVAVWVAIHKFFFGCLLFGFLFLVCFLAAELSVVPAGCAWRISHNHVAGVCCAWRNL